ncbi:MAG: 3-isopropylmalate dehydratase large subunit [Nitrososphaerota archaeon]|nr:3-isopropylmalate dehydratase large subunit [Candidatus Bathyarchaeota archaeon]MDW8022333.1 3-isopropylmalate dehydratase large subunit [Nitrososphaerota archaeon]
MATVAEKILAKASNSKRAEPGEFIVANVDFVFAHDGTAPLMIDVINEFGAADLRLAGKSALFIDHAAPSPSVQSSILHKKMREFAVRFGIKLFDVGEGVCHQVIMDYNLVKAGDVVVGADSHTTIHGAVGAFAVGVGSTDAAFALATGKLWFKVPESIKVSLKGKLGLGVLSKDIALTLLKELGTDGATYMAIEYHDELSPKLSQSSRATISNLSAEMGAKAGIFPVEPFTPDKGANYTRKIELDCSRLEPLVAKPPLPSNVAPVSEVESVEVNEVFIGSCTNGRLEDLEIAARILRGRKVKKDVRCIVIPASRQVYEEAVKKGLIETLVKAGCVIGPPTCGPCVGAHMGLLGPEETALSTANRNFTGRMGEPSAKIYLASPATAAATALEGKITDPRKYLRN